MIEAYRCRTHAALFLHTGCSDLYNASLPQGKPMCGIVSGVANAFREIAIVSTLRHKYLLGRTVRSLPKQVNIPPK